MIDICSTDQFEIDYTVQIKPDKLTETEPNRHIGGDTMESVHWFHGE